MSGAKGFPEEGMFKGRLRRDSLRKEWGTELYCR